MRLDIDRFIRTKGFEFKSDPAILAEKTRSLIAQKKISEAIMSVCISLLTAPKNFEVLDTLASLFEATGKSKLQLVVTEYNLETNPNKILSHLNHAEVLIRNHQKSKAVEVLQHAAVKFINNRNNLYDIASFLKGMGEHDLASKVEYSLLKNFDLTDGQYLEIIAHLIENQRPVPTYKHIKETRRLDLVSSAVRLAFADAHVRSGQANDALNFLATIDASSESLSVSNSAYMLEADIRLRLYDPSMAKQLLKNINFVCLKTDYEKSTYFHLLAKANRFLGKLSSAKDLYELSVKFEPWNFELNCEYLLVLEALGYHELAKTTRSTIQVKADDVFVYKTMFPKDNHNSSLTNKVEKVNSFNTKYSSVSDRGNIMVKIEDAEAQILKIKNVIQKGYLNNSEKTQGIYHLANAFVSKGEWEEAFNCWEFAGTQVRRKLNFDLGNFSARFFSDLSFLSEALIPSNRSSSEAAPIFCFGLPETGIEYLYKRLEVCSGLENYSSQFFTGELIDDFLATCTPELLLNPQSDTEFSARYEATVMQIKKHYETRRIKQMGFEFFSFDLTAISMLATIFPGALFFSCIEDEVPSLLNMYSKLYDRGNFFTYDFHELATVLAAYKTAIENLDHILDGRFVRLPSNMAVENNSAVVQKIIELREEGKLFKVSPAILDQILSYFDEPFEIDLKPLYHDQDYKQLIKHFSEQKSAYSFLA